MLPLKSSLHYAFVPWYIWDITNKLCIVKTIMTNVQHVELSQLLQFPRVWAFNHSWIVIIQWTFFYTQEKASWDEVVYKRLIDKCEWLVFGVNLDLPTLIRSFPFPLNDLASLDGHFSYVLAALLASSLVSSLLEFSCMLSTFVKALSIGKVV